MATNAEWIDAAARVFAGGHEDRCESKHGEHLRRLVHVNLGVRVLPDCPASPVGLSMAMHVFDADRYRNHVGFCEGDDELSRSVIAHGVWEPWETAVALQILTQSQDGLVIDLGSHVGWYTLLAAVSGHDVLAVDADWEHCEVLAMNAAINDVSDRVTVARGWVDATKPPLAPGPRVRLAKVDTEGADAECVRMLGRLLSAGDVDFVLIELSPEFGSAWLSAHNDLVLAGYRGYRIPTKGSDVDAFEADPLGVTLGRPLDVGLVDCQVSALFTR